MPHLTGHQALELYKAVDFPNGIPGFIDQSGIDDLLWVQDNLGGTMYIAGGKCPKCGSLQITIWMGYISTNCLKCGFRLELKSNIVQPRSKLLPEETIDIDYEEVVDFQPIVAPQTLKWSELLEEPLSQNPEIKWPTPAKRSLGFKVIRYIKRLFKKFI